MSKPTVILFLQKSTSLSQCRFFSVQCAWMFPFLKKTVSLYRKLAFALTTPWGCGLFCFLLHPCAIIRQLVFECISARLCGFLVVCVAFVLALAPISVFRELQHHNHTEEISFDAAFVVLPHMMFSCHVPDIFPPLASSDSCNHRHRCAFIARVSLKQSERFLVLVCLPKLCPWGMSCIC